MMMTIERLESLGYRKHVGRNSIMLSKQYHIGNFHSSVESEIERYFFFNLDGTLRSATVIRWTWFLAHDPKGRYIGLCSAKRNPRVHIIYSPER